jgi:hypothetical protein
MSAAARRKAKIREEAKSFPPAAEDAAEDLVLNTPVRPALREFSPTPAPTQGSSPDDIVQAALARLARIVEVSRDRTSATAAANAQFGLRQTAAAQPDATAEAAMAAPAEDSEDRTREAVEGLAAKFSAIGVGEAVAPMPEVTAAPAPQPSGPVAVETPAPPPIVAAEPAMPAVQAPTPMPAPAPLRAAPEEASAPVNRLAAAAAKMEEAMVAELRSRLEAVERGLAQMQGHLQVTGERSREAIEEMGRKVVDFDQSLTAAQTTQRLNTEAIEQLTGETSRVGRQVEERLERFDVAHAGILETMGAEVARMDQSVEARLAQSDAAHAQSLASLRGEVARIDQSVLEGLARAETGRAQALETLAAQAARNDQAAEEASRLAKSLEDRFARGEAAQAGALDKFNEKMTRISERLAERIAATDWRSAQAIEDVGERMAGASEQLVRRLEQTTADLVARVRLSEERTADIFRKAVDDIETLGGAASSPPPPFARLEPIKAFDAAEPEPLGAPDPIATYAPAASLGEEPLEMSALDADDSPPATLAADEDWAMEPTLATEPQTPAPAKSIGKSPAKPPTFGKASVKEPAKDAFWNRIGMFKQN